MRRLVLSTLALSVTPASADNAAQLFKKGKDLLAAKRYTEACPTFEKVDKLDPGIGAKLNVAKCYEEWGRLGTAFRWYRDAEQMARDTKDAREPKIHELIVALDADVPKLTLKIAADADVDAAAVTVDGAVIGKDWFNVAQRVDPGPHEIRYTSASGPKSKTIPIERGGATEITLDVPKLGADRTDPRPIDTDDTPSPGRGRRIGGLALAGAGVVGMGVAGIVTLSARSKYRDALEKHCMGDTDLCDDAGLTTTHDARKHANVATVITVIGAAAVAGGVVLYLTAPKRARTEHALYLAPTGRGVALGGSF
jgi:hypothetical protein